MGEKTREARQEASLTQAELAEPVHRRQAAIFQMERGQMLLDVETLVYLANALDKPISYFYPPPIRGAEEEGLSADEQELIHWFRQIWHKALQLVAIDQVRTLAESSIEADLEAARRDARTAPVADDR